MGISYKLEGMYMELAKLKAALDQGRTGKVSIKYTAGVLIRGQVRHVLRQFEARKGIMVIESKGWLESLFEVSGELEPMYATMKFIYDNMPELSND
jgi:hypothetical protein